MPHSRLKPSEAFRHLAKASRSDRRRSPARLLLLAALVLIPLGLFGWWILRQPALPEVALAAYDEVVPEGQAAHLCARVEALHAEEQPGELGGLDLYFQDTAGVLLAQVPTGRDGSATAEGAFPTSAGLVEYQVNYPGVPGKRRGARATARVFHWPSVVRILLVETDHTLPQDPSQLWTANNLDLRPATAAAAALRAAQSRCRILYWSPEGSTPTRYNKLRAWLDRSWVSPAERLPAGPLLTAACPATDPDGVLAALKGRFPSARITAVAARSEEAAILHEAGLESFLVGDLSPPAGVTCVKSWTDLGAHLAP
jgi:hypothetical protein